MSREISDRVKEALNIAQRMGLKIYPHQFGRSSNANLEGVLPELVDVADLAIRLCLYDGTIIPGGGLRSEEQAQQNVRNGTGILHSLHRRQGDGYGHAVDLIPLLPGLGIVWTGAAARKAFEAMAEAVKIAAALLDTPIRQGCDWNMNGTFGESREWDWPHFEKPKVIYRKDAKRELERFRRVLAIDEKVKRRVCCPNCGHEFAVSH